MTLSSRRRTWSRLKRGSEPARSTTKRLHFLPRFTSSTKRNYHADNFSQHVRHHTYSLGNVLSFYIPRHTRPLRHVIYLTPKHCMLSPLAFTISPYPTLSYLPHFPNQPTSVVKYQRKLASIISFIKSTGEAVESCCMTLYA